MLWINPRDYRAFQDEFNYQGSMGTHTHVIHVAGDDAIPNMRLMRKYLNEIYARGSSEDPTSADTRELSHGEFRRGDVEDRITHKTGGYQGFNAAR